MHLAFAITKPPPAHRWLPTSFAGAAAALLVGTADFSVGADAAPSGAEVRQDGFAVRFDRGAVTSISLTNQTITNKQLN